MRGQWSNDYSKQQMSTPSPSPAPFPRSRIFYSDQATVWELEQNERNLIARLEDQSEALARAEEARRGAEELAQTSSSDKERLAIEVCMRARRGRARGGGGCGRPIALV